MYVCIYVCMYTYIYTCIHTHTHTLTHTLSLSLTHTHKYIRLLLQASRTTTRCSSPVLLTKPRCGSPMLLGKPVLLTKPPTAAGFAHDALRLAAGGHRVAALERDPVIHPHALVQKGPYATN